MKKWLIFALCFLCAGCPSQFRGSLEADYLTADPSEYTQGGEPITWFGRDFPLMVLMDSSMPIIQQEAVRQAVHIWNEEAGAEVFRSPVVATWDTPPFLQPTPGYVVVSTVEQASPVLARAFFTTYRYMPDRMMHVHIVIDPGVHEDELVRVATHELGHALGLDHDNRTQASIMFPHAGVSGGQIMPNDLNYVRFQLP